MSSIFLSKVIEGGIEFAFYYLLWVVVKAQIATALYNLPAETK